MRHIFLKAVFSIFIVAVSANDSTAQDLQGGLHFAFGIPQGEFQTKVGKNGYGISGDFGFAPTSIPIMVGVEVGYLIYGSESRREPFSGTIPDVTVDVNTTNSILLAHLALRLQPNSGSIRPYLDGLIGVNYLSTSTKIENQGRWGEEVASSTNYDDAAFSYGGGGGVMFRLHESDSPDDGGISEVLLDLRGRYIVGKEAKYLKEGSIRRENGKVIYDIQTSKTDLMVIQLGVVVRF